MAKKNSEQNLEKIEAEVRESPEITFADSSDSPKLAKDLAKEKLQKLIAEETKPVQGRFRFFECPGASARIQVRKYPGIPMFDQVMVDNNVYKIPLYVARHLNGQDRVAEHCNCKTHTCSYPVHAYMFDPTVQSPETRDGLSTNPVPVIGVGSRTRRFGFESMEFEA